MKKTFLAAILICGGTAYNAYSAETDTLTIRDCVTGAYYPEYVYGVTPMADGETYSQLSDDATRIIRKSFKDASEVGTVFDCSAVPGCPVRRIGGYTMSPDEKTILFETQHKSIYRHSYTAVYYVCNLETKEIRPLSQGGPQQQPHFSPDGKKVAFVREGNLFIVDLAANTETQITTDGKFNEIINGLPDWVNEEEFTTACSFDFSADSKNLAWVRYDESQVPIYSMQMFKGLMPEHKENDVYPGKYDYKYPVAGEKNSEVSVLSYNMDNGATTRMNVPLETDGYIPRIRFTSDPAKLAVVTLNRHQDRMNIYMVNPSDGTASLTLSETSDKYVKETAYESLNFYGDKFAYISARDGHQHIYLYDLNGNLVRQATKGTDDVTELYGYDPKADHFYYAAKDGSPMRQAVFCVDKKGKVTKLSKEAGDNSATFSASMKYFMNVYSSSTNVPVTTLCDNKGKMLSTLKDNAALAKKAETVLGQKDFFSFTTSEGVLLNGWMVKPRNFDPTRKYPVVMYQYSGPGSQEVKDAWGMGFLGQGAVFESYLAQEGIIVACVDGRGTGGRGIDFEQCTYLNIGDKESKDQVEAAIYLGSLPYIDKDRIAIWGWSFGGFNTLMSMSEGRPVFRAGVAVAAPSNWKFYDTVYTERYMRTPSENPNGYACNPIQRASKLHGDLLLIHGTADDNVHFRNFTEMTEALVQADKQFDQAIYTNRNHSIYGGNTRYQLFTKITNFLMEKLK